MPQTQMNTTALTGRTGLWLSGAGLLAALLLPLQAAAASETRELDDFAEVSFSLPFEVEFVVADSHYITFEGDQDTIDDIKTRVTGDTLKVYKDNSWFDWSDDEVMVTIGFVELEAITLAGSGDGFAEVLEAEQFKLSLTGSSNMEIKQMRTNELKIAIAGAGDAEIHELDADSVSSTIAGSGDITLSGRVVSQQISISGSGDLDASELRSQETTASVRGSGDVKVWAEAHLATSIVGSGDVAYYGEPSLKERIVGSGDVVQLGKAP